MFPHLLIVICVVLHLNVLLFVRATPSPFVLTRWMCEGNITCEECGTCKRTGEGEICDRSIFLHQDPDPPKYPAIYNESCGMKDLCQISGSCINNVSCTGTFGSVSCVCKDGFYGQSCENEVVGAQKTDFASKVSVMYNPYSKALKKVRFMVIIGHLGTNFEVHFNYGLGFTLIQDSKSAKLNNPKRICWQCNVATFHLCDNLVFTDQVSVFMFEVTYPYSRLKDRNLISNYSNVLYKTGRKYEINVKVLNNLIAPIVTPITFDKTYRKVIWYEDRPGDECTPRLNVKFCSTNDKHMPVLYRDNSKQIDGTASVGEFSCHATPLKKWQVWKYGVNFDEGDNTIYQTKYESDANAYKIQEYTLQPSKYIIKLSARVEKQEKILFNFVYCFFEMKILPLIATLGPLSRTASSKQDLKLDASGSGDPNEPQDNQGHVRFSFKCLTTKKDFCKEHNTTVKEYVIPHGDFKVGKSYTFVLTVYTVNGTLPPVSTKQNIRFTRADGQNLMITCTKNCGFGMFSTTIHEIVYLEVSPDDGSHFLTTLNYIWTYSVNESVEHDIIEIKQPEETPSNILIIDEEKLNVSSTYVISVTVSTADIETSFEILTGGDPIMGNCSISPLEGIMGITNFTISCLGFDSQQPDDQLTYEFYDNKPNKIGLGVYLGSSQDGFMKKLLLVGGIITVHVMDSINMYVRYNLTVKLTIQLFSEMEISTMMEKLEVLEEGGNKEGVMRLIAVLTEVVHYVKKEQDLLFYCLNIIEQLKEHDVDSLKLLSSGLSNFLQMVTFNDTGVDGKSAQIAGYILRNLGEEFLYHVVEILMLDHFIETRSLRQISMFIVEACEVLLKSNNDSIVKLLIQREGDIDVEVKYKEGLISMMTGLKSTTRAVGHNLLPYQRRFSTISSNVSLWARLTGDAIEMSEFTKRTHNLPFYMSPELAMELKNKTNLLAIEAITLNRNPFWWYRGCYNEVQSTLVSLDIRKKKRKLRSPLSAEFIRLKNPLDIFMNLTNIDLYSVSGSVYTLTHDADDDAKDLSIFMHRIETPIGAKLLIEFVDVSDPLTVLVIKDKIPDYGLMEELGTTITKKNYKYDVKETALHQESFFYIGILPGKDAPLNKNKFDFTFNITAVNCAFWQETILRRSQCKVAQDSNISYLHCRCYHLSTFTGSKVKAHNLINQIDNEDLVMKNKDNFTVYIVIIVLMVFYLLMLLWAWCRDRKTVIENSVVVLDDNYPGEEYGYLVTVYTGARIGAGTNANVGIRLFGKEHNSRAHILKSPDRKTMQRNNDDWFLLFTPFHLGQLIHIHIWHDNTSKYSDWYCEKILVYDLEAREEYIFPIGQWLAPGFKEYLQTYMAPLPKDDKHTRAKLAVENALLGFREMHVWASIFIRHPRSSVTTAQRVAVCMCTIMLALVISLMYYSFFTSSEDEPYFVLRTRELLIIIIIVIITAPIICFILFLFRKTREEVVISEGTSDDVTQIDGKSRVVGAPKETKRFSYDSMRYLRPEGTLRDYRYSRISEKTFYDDNISYRTIHTMFQFKPLKPVKIVLKGKEEVFITHPIWLAVAWIISQAVIIICAVLIVIYGQQVGTIKSHIWLVTAGLAVVQDIVLFLPIKIILISLLLGFSYGILFDVATFHFNTEEAMRKELVGDVDYLFQLEKIRSHPMYHPLSRSQIKVLRDKRNRYISWMMFLEFLIISIFLLLLLVLVQDIYTAKHFHKNNQIKIMLIHPSTKDSLGFYDVFNLKSFHLFVANSFFPKIFKTLWYNKEMNPEFVTSKFGRSGWFMDETHRLVGIPSIRQLRVRKDACSVPDLIKNSNIGVGCIAALTKSTEETRNFKYFWDILNAANDSVHTPYIYVKPDKSRDISLHGFTGVIYHSGGYITYLGRNMRETNYSLSEMKFSDWLDMHTRFIVIELALYNVNTNTYSLVKFMLENLPGSAFIQRAQVMTIEVMKNLGLILAIFVVLIIFFLFKNLYNLNHQGFFNYFSKFWNYYEIFLLILSFANLYAFITSVIYAANRTQDFETAGKDVFFSYATLIYHYHLIVILLFFIILCCMIRLLRTFKLGRRVVIMCYTLSFSARSVMCITVVFILCLLLQSLVISYRLNEPFASNWNMFFMYKSGFRDVHKQSIFPHKYFCVFIYCLSAAIFNGVFIVLYSYYYRIAKGHKLMRPELLNYFTFFKKELFSDTKKKSSEVNLPRLRGGMDVIKPILPKSYEKLMLLRINNFIKSYIIHAQNTEGDTSFKERRLKSDSYKCTKQISEILEFEISYFDINLSCVISKIDDILSNANISNNVD